ncbi:MAG TPA: zinc ribbon domain-containing protein [Candidatus Bathyarchaeia archaeon]|nr:zinc ribbon domain-containing protein [Candidatus Bathyarchaeia archaeon]
MAAHKIALEELLILALNVARCNSYEALMDEHTPCARCGAANQIDSRFCARCGAPIQRAVENSSGRPLAKLTSSQRRTTWDNKHYVLYAVVTVVIIAAFWSIPYAFRQSDYANTITTYYLSEGDSIVKPFEHTSVFGADAYVGTVGKNLTIANETIFPRSSDTDAHRFQQTVVNQLEAQGFVTLHTVAGTWLGVTNSSEVGVAALTDGNSPTGNSAVLVVQTPLSAGPTTS